MASISITPLTTAIGAQVEGINLREPLGDNLAEQIRAALWRHSVLVFRDQHLDDEQQTTVAALFGPIEPPPSRKLFGHLESVRTIEAQLFSAADDSALPYGARQSEYRWHVDDGFCRQIPRGATLRPLVIPGQGGDTYWTNMAAVYESFSPSLQGWLESLVGIHAAPPNFLATVGYFDLSSEEQRRFREQEAVNRHPLVVRHPETGRKSLFVSPAYTVDIEGLSPRESSMLLRFLFAEAARPDFVYRHHWREGDLIIWDELPTMHQGPDSFAPERQLVRIYGGLVTPEAAPARREPVLATGERR